MRRPVVMGNWKLNGSKAMVTELLTGLNAELEGVEGVDIVRDLDRGALVALVDPAHGEVGAGGEPPARQIGRAHV